MKIKIMCNLVVGGFSAKQLETGIGGSEEKLIELTREWAKEHDVTIYMNGEHGTFDGVKYEAHNKFIPWEEHDVFISFKAAHILDQTINAKKIFHWTTEIETKWETSRLNSIDKIICISDFHVSAMQAPAEKLLSSYLWADLDRLDRNKVDREEGTMLYSSSFDRGLEDLLSRWGLVKERLGLKTLYITYGWDFIDKVIKHNPQMRYWKEKMLKLMEQEGVVQLGLLSNDDMCKMYWKAEYWALPLNNPNSELFCINAIKAQYCGSKPVVKLAGALQETVNEFIPYEFIIEGREFQNLDQKAVIANKKHASKFSLKTQIKEWTSLIG